MRARSRPGELRGTRQSGLPDLQLGDLTQDVDLIEKARELAERMLEADPRLEAAWAERLRAELRRRTRAVGRQFVGDLVPLQHVLERADPDAVILGGAQQGQ